MGDSILLSCKWSQAPCPAGCLAWRCSEAVQNLSISLQRGPAHSCSENHQEQPSLSKDGPSPFLFSLDSKGKLSRCPGNRKAHQRAAALPPDSLCSRLLGQTPTRGSENLGPGLLQTLNSGWGSEWHLGGRLAYTLLLAAPPSLLPAPPFISATPSQRVSCRKSVTKKPSASGISLAADGVRFSH